MVDVDLKLNHIPEPRFKEMWIKLKVLILQGGSEFITSGAAAYNLMVMMEEEEQLGLNGTPRPKKVDFNKFL